MNINEKIEEIRKKPENERLRYVWGAVFICMFFVVAIWIVSLKDTFNSNNSSASDSGNSSQTDLMEISNLGE